MTNAPEGPSRRSVTKGVAWSVPVLTVGAPAAVAAASAGPPTKLDWNNVPAGRFTSGVAGLVTVAATLTITEGSALSRNGVVASDTQGGDTGRKYFLELAPKNKQKGADETITFSFSEPVKDVSITLYGVDNSGTGDQVTVLTGGFTVSGKGSKVSGDGTAASPFTGTAPVAATSTDGNVTLTWPGPLSSIAMRYFNGDAGTANMVIAMSGINFTANHS
ncbi:hypothetical protein [Calidifontibacter terrae]